MVATQSYTGVLVAVSCCTCGVMFGLDQEHRNKRVKDHESFWCPNGHKQYFSSETEEERLARALECERRRADANFDRAQRERASLVATKGHVTRLKRRIASGQCPCCKESFSDLAAHMASEHPEYAD